MKQTQDSGSLAHDHFTARNWLEHKTNLLIPSCLQNGGRRKGRDRNYEEEWNILQMASETPHLEEHVHIHLLNPHLSLDLPRAEHLSVLETNNHIKRRKRSGASRFA